MVCGVLQLCAIFIFFSCVIEAYAPPSAESPTLERAHDLLGPDEKIPDATQRVYRYVDTNNMRVHPNKNLPKTDAQGDTCGNIAPRRQRSIKNGQEGIPVYDEMKTRFCAVMCAGGEVKYTLVHCRGNEEINYDSVARQIEGASGSI